MQRRRKRQNKQRRQRQAPRPTRGQAIAGLPREPRRWDILMHQLGVALSKTLWKGRKHGRDPLFRLTDRQTAGRGLLLAEAVTEAISDRSLNGCWCPEPCPWHADEKAAESLTADLAETCLRPLLRKMAEDLEAMPPPRPHPPLDRLVDDFRLALHQFLLDRCLPGGDLHSCLTDPIGDPEDYFSKEGECPVPQSTGDPARDAYWLGPRIHDPTNIHEVKGTLIRFARGDPWLSGECMAYVNQRLEEEQPEDERSWQMWADQATDDFLFRSTRLAGWSPLELLLARQHHLREEQLEPIRRWQREQFSSIFEILYIDSPAMSLRDLADDQRYEAAATRSEALRAVRPGVIFVSRLVPWGDRWLLSGTQRTVAPSRDQLADLERRARHSPLGRRHEEDPALRRAFEIQRREHAVWLELFGDEEVLCANGREAEEATTRFMAAWLQRLGWSESARRETQQPSARELGALSEELRAASDVGIIFPREHGMHYLVHYGAFRRAFERADPPSEDELELIRDYLTDDSVGYWVFERMRDRWPERTEQLLGAALRDECFQLERDFEPVLAKFKGEQMRQPLQPTVTVAEDVRPPAKTPTSA